MIREIVLEDSNDRITFSEVSENKIIAFKASSMKNMICILNKVNGLYRFESLHPNLYQGDEDRSLVDLLTYLIKDCGHEIYQFNNQRQFLEWGLGYKNEGKKIVEIDKNTIRLKDIDFNSTGIIAFYSKVLNRIYLLNIDKSSCEYEIITFISFISNSIWNRYETPTSAIKSIIEIEKYPVYYFNTEKEFLEWATKHIKND